MTRLVLLLVGILALSAGLSWLAEQPGRIDVDWGDYRADFTVFQVVVAFLLVTGLAMIAWSIARHLWQSPAAVGQFLMKRKQKRGLDALSSGMIAVGAGDRGNAMRYAMQARKTLPNEPLTHLLRAQAAQLSGDKATARRIFEAMLASPDTEQLGLRGLYLEASRLKENEPARQFAERAVRLNPKLSWPVEALFDLQCKDGDWDGALETLAIARKNGHADKTTSDRRRAVLLTTQAQAMEEGESEKALTLALEAHTLAPSLVPAAAIAGRLLASRGNTPKAAKILQKAWSKSPHPDLATAYAFARIGDSPRDRLDRVKQLAALSPQSIESPIAIATTAIDAKSFDDARRALQPLLDGRLTQRVATLMARIEGEEHGDKGKVREWLARAVNAPRDPAWTADGIVSSHWAPVSPVTGQLDAFQWRVPVDDMQSVEGDELTTRLESLVTLGAPVEGAFAPADEQPNSPHAAEPRESARRPGATPVRPVEEVEDLDEVPRTVAPSVKHTAPQPAKASAEPPRAHHAASDTEVEIKTSHPNPAERLNETARTTPPLASPGTGKAAMSELKPKTRAESRREEAAFAPPHAPDDPGPEPEEIADFRAN